MVNVYPVFKRELKSYFSSPIAYVVLFIFLAICGYIFFVAFQFFVRSSFEAIQAQQDPYRGLSPYKVNVTEHVVRPMFGTIGFIMLWILPILTMRLFSEEKKLGTSELLFSYPLREWETILGKFGAALAVFVVMILFTTVYPLMLKLYGKPEIPTILSAYAGLFLAGTAFLALGTFISSMTESQVIAAVVSFGSLLIIYIVGWLTEIAQPPVSTIAKNISLIERMESFSKGIIETESVVFYILFTAFFLFLTLCSLGSNRWRR